MGGQGSGGYPPRKIRMLRRAKPDAGLGEAPPHFDEETRDVWNYAVAHAPAGILRTVDLSVLELWCTAHVLHRRAMVGLRSTGLVMDEIDPSPYLAIANKQADILLRTIAQLGFSPYSRTRLASDPADSRGDWADVTATG